MSDPKELAQAVKTHCETVLESIDIRDFQQDLGDRARDWWWTSFTVHRRDFIEKIVSFIERAQEDPNGCLVTSRPRQQLSWRGRKEYVYRMIAHGLAGTLPTSRDVVRHLCSNDRCIHPEHLRIGTTRQNAWDHRFECSATFGGIVDDPYSADADAPLREPFRPFPLEPRAKITPPKAKPLPTTKS